MPAGARREQADGQVQQGRLTGPVRADQPGHPARHELAALWPMVSAAAGAAQRSLSPGGLPTAATDYWEHGTQVTLGTAAPLLAGLRAATGIAAALGRAQAAQSWADDAARLAGAIQASFGCYGFQPAAG